MSSVYFQPDSTNSHDAMCTSEPVSNLVEVLNVFNYIESFSLCHAIENATSHSQSTNKEETNESIAHKY